MIAFWNRCFQKSVNFYAELQQALQNSREYCDLASIMSKSRKSRKVVILQTIMKSWRNFTIFSFSAWSLGNCRFVFRRLLKNISMISSGITSIWKIKITHDNSSKHLKITCRTLNEAGNSVLLAILQGLHPARTAKWFRRRPAKQAPLPAPLWEGILCENVLFVGASWQCSQKRKQMRINYCC